MNIYKLKNISTGEIIWLEAQDEVQAVKSAVELSTYFELENK